MIHETLHALAKRGIKAKVSTQCSRKGNIRLGADIFMKPYINQDGIGEFSFSVSADDYPALDDKIKASVALYEPVIAAYEARVAENHQAYLARRTPVEPPTANTDGATALEFPLAFTTTEDTAMAFKVPTTEEDAISAYKFLRAVPMNINAQIAGDIVYIAAASDPSIENGTAITVDAQAATYEEAIVELAAKAKKLITAIAPCAAAAHDKSFQLSVPTLQDIGFLNPKDDGAATFAARLEEYAIGLRAGRITPNDVKRLERRVASTLI